LENVEFQHISTRFTAFERRAARRDERRRGTNADVKLRETGKRYRRKITNFVETRNGKFSRRLGERKAGKEREKRTENAARRRRTSVDGAAEERFNGLTSENAAL
jgi:hypothetical protein